MDCAAEGSARALDCRVMSATERLTLTKNATDTFFPSQMQNIFGPLRLLFVSFCSEATPQSSVGWKSFETEAKAEASGGGGG